MKVKISDIIKELEHFAPGAYQENYDNSGLLLGHPDTWVERALLCIDITEPVIEEAIAKKAGLIIAHHPLIFKGLKKITGRNEVERCVIKAIKNDIAIFAGHTNFDNVNYGVNHKIATKLGLVKFRALEALGDSLEKLVVFVPEKHARLVRDSMFQAGAGKIGNYDSCSFNIKGTGTFRAGEEAHPFVGENGKLHSEAEIRIETVVPSYLTQKVVQAMIAVHPYEEVAYDIFPLHNFHPQHGAGGMAEFVEELPIENFFELLKSTFHLKTFKHTAVLKEKIKKVAFCGGAGSFLLHKAMAAGADVFISGDFKYHEFFQAENHILICDIGHYESEQFTKEVFYELLTKKIPNFALYLSEVNTNPVYYY